MMANANKFDVTQLPVIKSKLSELPDDKYYVLQALDLKNPSTILLIAIFLGWERFFLEDVGMGILKILTRYECGIWGIVDMFTAQSRAREYNFKKLMQATSI